MLALLKGFPLDQMSPTDPEFVHLWTECAKLAYADREAFYGDPKFVEVPMQTLLSEAYNAERRKLVGAEASMEQRPGHDRGLRRQGDRQGRAGGRRRRRRADLRAHCTPATAPMSSRAAAARCVGDTVHIDIIDRPATCSRPRRRAAGCSPRR